MRSAWTKKIIMAHYREGLYPVVGGQQADNHENRIWKTAHSFHSPGSLTLFECHLLLRHSSVSLLLIVGIIPIYVHKYFFIPLMMLIISTQTLTYSVISVLRNLLRFIGSNNYT